MAKVVQHLDMLLRGNYSFETSKTFCLDVNLRFIFQLSKLILMFSVLGRFVKRSVVIGSCLLFHVFLLFFEACIVAKE